MNERIKRVRKALHLSQDEFAEKLSLSRNFIFLIEKGERIPSDRTKADICRVFGVSPVWLETGEGDPFPPKSREDEIADVVTAALPRSSEEDRKLIIEKLSMLTDGEISMLAVIMERMFPSN